jgi:Sec-independent protein secretion pathway component TatC
MEVKAKGAQSERKARQPLKELEYSLLGVIIAVIIIGFVIGAWFISPLVSIVRRVVRKMSRE